MAIEIPGVRRHARSPGHRCRQEALAQLRVVGEPPRAEDHPAPGADRSTGLPVVHHRTPHRTVLHQEIHHPVAQPDPAAPDLGERRQLAHQLPTVPRPAAGGDRLDTAAAGCLVLLELVVVGEHLAVPGHPRRLHPHRPQVGQPGHHLAPLVVVGVEEPVVVGQEAEGRRLRVVGAREADPGHVGHGVVLGILDAGGGHHGVAVDVGHAARAGGSAAMHGGLLADRHRPSGPQRAGGGGEGGSPAPHHQHVDFLGGGARRGGR